MNFKRNLCVLTGLLAAAMTVSGEEILVNRDFSQSANGVPTRWEYQKHRSKPEYKLNPANGTEPANVQITTSENGQGLLMFRLRKKYPAGTRFTVSGEYQTSGIVFGRNGLILSSATGKYSQRGAKQPTFWLNSSLKPSETWTTFKYSGRVKFPLEYVQYNVGLVNAKGTLKLRNLSVDTVLPSDTPDPKEEFVWREAEDIEKVKLLSTWGKDLEKDYYSGRGGIFTDKGNFDWNFQIPEVTDPVTLFSKPRTWYLWARIYGYMDSPRIMVYRNDRFLAFVDTPGNEKRDKKGQYAGPGKYIWVLCGQFTTTGGLQQISLRPKGRLLLDALLLTTDGKYAPVKFEAKDVKQAPIQDIATANMIKAEYNCEGVSDTITLPLSFRIGGKKKIIPNDKNPAVFHFSLPSDIEVKGMTSHFAGENWSAPARWGKKFLTWKKTGSRTVNGIEFNDYEANLYYLSGNQYMVFLKANPKGFRARKESVCEYWLESGKEKQLKERIVLKHIAIQPAVPFKKIYIGPSYVPLNMMYISYPDLFTNFRNCGLNYIGAWAEPWKSKNFLAFRDQAYKNNCLITVVVRQYTGAKKQHVATGIDGKQLLKGGSGQGGNILTLAMTEKDAPIGETLERTRLCASTGINVEFDDEMTNVLWDKIDYSPAVKKLFREWLAENRKGVEYKEPELIVRDRQKDAEMYRHWVDFKCARIAYWYSLYRKAFDEGAAKAPKGEYPPPVKPMMLTCVQGLVVGRDGKPCNAEAIKEAGYLDYRLLGKYCDIIQMMSYTYGGVRESALPGDKMELYNAYTGKNNTAPILLAGGYGTETTPENKVMLKYQVWDCLMQKPKIIVFYAGATLFNTPTLAPVVEAIRIARPYEDFFVDGEKYTEAKAASVRVRLKGLKLGGKVLLYATNYDNIVGPAETVNFPSAPKSVLDCITGKKIEVKGNGFSFDFKTSRGKLFLVEM
ncbi:MAG: hypothetical protein E7055_18105 [Lentisphaerae bacterium]|nr:hypothetical protein [Lentisphaerota bacterium]